MLSQPEIKEKLNSVTGLDLVLNEEGPEPFIVVPAEKITPVMEALFNNEELKFDVLMSQTGMHKDDKIYLYYHLYSMKNRHRLTVESEVSLDKAEIDSVVQFWKIADWLERETYDLLGVEFKGHPNLRRIMLPDDWEGYPLRKDYVKPSLYDGIDNSPSAIAQSFQPKGK